MKGKAEECCIFLCQQPKVGVGLMSRYLLESANSACMKGRKDKGRAVVLCRLKLLDVLLDGVVQERQEAGGASSCAHHHMHHSDEIRSYAHLSHA